ncbi:carboxypeptidase regulatory-like domain-containing protein [Longispora sp. K20-0274]|uniref:hypothetical protein n=1 Tax=Longispora sp. K20-0274 TaxID=3088255 RepID=UPI003999CD04
MRRMAGRMWPVVTTFCAVLLTAAPAVAADEISATFSPAAVTLGVGGAPVNVALTLTNTSPVPGTASLSISLPAELVAQGVQFAAAAAGCQATPTVVTCPAVPVPASSNAAVTVSLAAPAQSGLAAGQNVAGALTATGSFVTTTAGAIAATVPVTLNGPVNTGVPAVTGRVLDLDAKPVPGAVVTITDAAGKSRGVTSTDTGAFTYTAASAAEQFVAGTLTMVATKSGYTPTTVTRTGTPGLAVSDVDITVTLTAAAAPNAVQKIEKSPVAGAAAKEDEGGPLLTILVIVGVLLLAGGGACVYFLLRKGRDGDEGPARPMPTVYRSSSPQPEGATQLLRTVPGSPSAPGSAPGPGGEATVRVQPGFQAEETVRVQPGTHAPAGAHGQAGAHEPTVRVQPGPGPHAPASAEHEPTVRVQPGPGAHGQAGAHEPTVRVQPGLHEPTALRARPTAAPQEQIPARDRPGREPKPWDWLDD